MTFQAVMLEQQDGQTQARLASITPADLPDEEVLVAIDYSTLNYKDALAITGQAPVVRRFPLVPGIDCAGKVLKSRHADFQQGDAVILNGWGVGEQHWGGLAQQASLKGDWLIHQPAGMSSRQAMTLGTAGYTAMLCVMALERHGITPEQGPVLVTGAAGGVGSVAVALLSRLGYQVVASTGRPAEADFLTQLGAQQVIDRAELSAPSKPLAKERWAAAIDSVGSHTLANVCASLQYRGVVAACGLAQGMDLPASVAPFILRGITLAGVDSVYCPKAERQAAWQRLSALLDQQIYQQLLLEELPLAQAIEQAPALLAGQIRGRLLVDVNR